MRMLRVSSHVWGGCCSHCDRKTKRKGRKIAKRAARAREKRQWQKAE